MYSPLTLLVSNAAPAYRELVAMLTQLPDCIANSPVHRVHPLNKKTFDSVSLSA
jgi:hypothetical protein